MRRRGAVPAARAQVDVRADARYCEKHAVVLAKAADLGTARRLDPLAASRRPILGRLHTTRYLAGDVGGEP